MPENNTVSGDIRVLSGNMLKYIAALSMLIDHVGVILFPWVWVLRVIGRLAFPIFAFMIAEGCRYTRDKRRYFASVFLLALICQGARFFYDRSLEMNVLVTFSLSILLIYGMQYFKETAMRAQGSFLELSLALLPFLAAALLTAVVNYFFDVDYGVWGCTLPLFAAIFHAPRGAGAAMRALDKRPVHVLTMAVGLVPMCISSLRYGGVQIFSLFAIPLLLLYSGKRGRWGSKYFFYVFYPTHILVLEGIKLLIK